MAGQAQSQWQSIRPWSPRLSLSIREITSVSVTFILASTLTGANGEPELFLASLGLVADDDEAQEHDDDDDESFMDNKKETVISNALTKGFSINVNGVPWQRVLIRIDDKTDEAVIIIYGLMPGRQYDVDLGLVQGGQNSSIRRHVTTDDPSKAIVPHQEIDIAPSELLTSTPTSPTPAMSTPTQTSTPHSDAGRPSLTIEERHQQLQADLASINTDRENLTASLKSSRRDAQKADAALRSEIDVLKRASEKHAAAEHRARQKVLALQEAVKRAQAATKEVEGIVRDVEAALPSLRQQRDEKENEYSRAKEELERAQREWDKETEKDKKRIETVTAEFTALCNKMERLNAKKEKLESSVISDLEAQLKDVEREIEMVESDSASGHRPLWDGEEIPSFDIGETNNVGVSDDMMEPFPATGAHHPSPHPLPVQRQRHQSQHSLGAIARPPSAIAPIQRPSIPNPPNQQALWTPPSRSPQFARPVPAVVHPVSSPSHHPSILTHRPLLPPKAPGPTPPGIVQLSNSTLATSTPGPVQASVTTLSSRAPPFEPNVVTVVHPPVRSTAHPSSAVETNVGASYSVPIHRPRTSISNPPRAILRPGSSK